MMRAEVIRPDVGVTCGGRVAERRRGALALLTAVTAGLANGREPRVLRERFESGLKTLVNAKAVALRDDPPAPPGPGAPLALPVPSPSSEWRARLEALFEAGVRPDDWTYQLLELSAQVGALILEIEHARGFGRRIPRAVPDAAAPLIGSSAGIRSVRERIERVAPTDFTVLIEGASRR